MSEAQAHKIYDSIAGWFRTLAKRHRRRLESELKEVPTSAAVQRKKEIAEERRADLKRLEKKYGLFSDSAKLIREDRDARG